MNVQVQATLPAVVCILLICTCNLCEASGTLYVKPTSNASAPCPGEPCYPFSFYMENNDAYITSNTTLEFLAGEHKVVGTGWAIFTSISNLTLKGEVSMISNDPQQQSSIIRCVGSSGLMFTNISELNIIHLIVSDCGNAVPGYTLGGSVVAIGIVNLHMYSTVIRNGKGYGLLGFNVLGNFTVLDVIFTKNRGSSKYVGGNVLLDYNDEDCYRALDVSTLNITSTQILFGNNPSNYFNPAGIHIAFRQQCYQVVVNMYNNTFIGNRARIGLGGSMSLGFYEQVPNTVFIHDSYFEDGRGGVGGGIAIFSDASDPCYLGSEQHNTVHIANTNFIGNSAQLGGAIGIVSNPCINIHVNISSVNFSGNTAALGNGGHGSGGHIVILYVSPSQSSSTITIKDSEFRDGRAGGTGGGIAIVSNSDPLCNASITSHRHTLVISHCQFVNNSADYMGGGAIISLGNCSAHYVLLHRTNFFHNHVIINVGIGGNIALTTWGSHDVLIEQSNIESGSANVGGGVFFRSESASNSIPKVILRNCTLVDNVAEHGAALYIGVIGSQNIATNISQVHELLRIEDCIIQGGQAQFSNVQLHISQTGSFAIMKCGVYFTNTLFIGHHPSRQGGITLYAIYNAVFINCKFINSSTRTAINVFSTNLVFQGNITFEGNQGIDGGALSLCKSSLMFLRPHTHITFINNHAIQRGGAIFVEHICELLREACFFQIDALPGRNVLDHDILVEFENNTAGYAGSALYGGDIDYCDFPNEVILENSTVAFESIFKILDGQGSSVITSDPRGVCICINSIPKCGDEYSNFTYPGKTFQVSVALVGQLFGTVPGAVHAKLKNNQSKVAVLGDLQDSQAVSNTCTVLNYTVFSSNKSEIIVLQPGQLAQPFSDQKYPPLPEIQIILEFCPPGFELTYLVPTRCDCIIKLKSRGVTCDIETEIFVRPPPLWIGYEQVPAHNATILKHVVVHDNFPFDYCKSEEVPFTLDETNKQCAFNHSGVLCGGCQSGLSLALGTSQCMKCSNAYLSLIIPFAAAGFVLVFLLTAWDLTVAEGTINGLIFYANVIHTNRAIFFPHAKTNPLAVFIAWLNLDLGIETCFYDGMDVYAKIWLQFVFPIYIWLIVGIMIVSSHYFTTAAKLFRRNAVKVLATLFLLSFTKLLRTIIAALSFTYLEYSDGTRKTLWLYDGNVECFKGKHIPLFLAALFALTVLLLPYTLLLVSAQWLQSRSGHRLLSWVTRLKPFLDAYTGPYKDKYRFWTGFLLMIRIVLFLVFALNALGDPTVNLLAIIIISSWLMGFAPYVYKKLPLTLLERSFFFNLCVVSAATFYTLHTNKNQTAVIYTSTSIAFATFCGTFSYHTYYCITTSRMWARLMSKLSNRQDLHEEDEMVGMEGEGLENEEHCQVRAAVRPLVLIFNEYREPVLDYEDTTL